MAAVEHLAQPAREGLGLAGVAELAAEEAMATAVLLGQRIHTRRGGQIVKPIPNSMRITGTIAEWEEWTGMAFPGDGLYTFPAGLAPVAIDHEDYRGSYWEPNVWIVHTLRS